MTPEEIISYYQNLLIVQYRILPKATATIALLANEAYAQGLPMTLARCFDLDIALGAQLNILGNIVGVPRYVYGFSITNTYFSFVRYNDITPRPGFGRYNSNPYPSAIWLRYINNSITTMTDFQMFNCILLKIIQNNTYTNLKDVSDALFSVFGTNITVVDNRKMAIVYHANAVYYPILEIAQFLNILPRSMGVSLQIATP